MVPCSSRNASSSAASRTSPATVLVVVPDGVGCLKLRGQLEFRAEPSRYRMEPPSVAPERSIVQLQLKLEEVVVDLGRLLPLERVVPLDLQVVVAKVVVQSERGPLQPFGERSRVGIALLVARGQ